MPTKGRGPTDSAAEFLQNLLTIEVNMVVKSGLTARKLPPIPVAILEIAGKYYWFLHSLCEELNVDDHDLSGLESQQRKNGTGTFDALRKTAELLMNHDALAPRGSRASDHVIIERIYRTSAFMPNVLERLKKQNDKTDVWDTTLPILMSNFASLRGVRADQGDLAFIRKAWEIGVERVVMQSSLQLDGDIVTRIDSEYISADMRELHNLHLEICRMGVSTWTTMAQLAADFIGGALKSLGRLIGLAH